MLIVLSCWRVAAFARRKRRKAAGGKMRLFFPRTPSLPGAVFTRLHGVAALDAADSFEFPLNAEGIRCIVAARLR